MYEVKTVNGHGGPTGDHRHKKLLREGWELVNDKGGFLMTGRTRTYRRLNPKYVGNGAPAPQGAPHIEATLGASPEERQAAANENLAKAQAELAESRAEYYRIKAERAEKREAKRAAKDEKKAAKAARKAAQ